LYKTPLPDSGVSGAVAGTSAVKPFTLAFHPLFCCPQSCVEVMKVMIVAGPLRHSGVRTLSLIFSALALCRCCGDVGHDPDIYRE